MVKNTLLSAGLIAAAGALVAVSGAGAQTVSFGGASGNYSGDAVFGFAAGQVTITIYNNNNNSSQSDGNGIIAIGFDLSGNPSLTVDDSAVVGDELGYTATSKSKGTLAVSKSSVTDGPAGSSQSMANPWSLDLDQSGYPTYLLGELNSGQPSDLVLNPSEGANPSVEQHSPSLESGATFTLDSATITAATTASNIEVYFGTERSNNLPTGTAVPAGGPLPIPATLPLVGGGLLGLGLIALRQRRQMRMR